MHYSYTSAILWITHINTSINGLISTFFAPSNDDAADGTKTHPKQANKSCLFLKIYQKPHCELEICCGKGNIIKPTKWIFRTNIYLTNVDLWSAFLTLVLLEKLILCIICMSLTSRDYLCDLCDVDGEEANPAAKHTPRQSGR